MKMTTSLCRKAHFSPVRHDMGVKLSGNVPN
jgi:hypothetical protein